MYVLPLAGLQGLHAGSSSEHLEAKSNTRGIVQDPTVFSRHSDLRVSGGRSSRTWDYCKVELEENLGHKRSGKGTRTFQRRPSGRAEA